MPLDPNIDVRTADGVRSGSCRYPWRLLFPHVCKLASTQLLSRDVTQPDAEQGRVRDKLAYE